VRERKDDLVLVVEDHPDMRDALAEILSLEHFDVVTAEHGAEALRILATLPSVPRVIVLDLHMPVMDGFAFRRAQLADVELAGIPVVVLSADDAAARHARDLGVSIAVNKSNIEHLVRAVYAHA
jgi:CheY-like chemotaxis protein